ncbi:MAG TPA: dihydrofolate reductase family protein [Puia sp.]|nr:dihydrofolate reductase family protein [Puia sp.]
MRNLILVVHISLDGFVAGPNGEFDGFDAGEENLQFVCSLTENADAALFGRNSYELLEGAWPTAKDQPNASNGTIAYSKWYNKAKKIVISTSLNAKGKTNTVVIGKNIPEEVAKIKKEPGKDILLFGSPRASQTLLKFGLIDGYWIFVNPAIFGSGISLFEEGSDIKKLKLEKTHLFPNGEIALYYTNK